MAGAAIAPQVVLAGATLGAVVLTAIAAEVRAGRQDRKRSGERVEDRDLERRSRFHANRLAAVGDLLGASEGAFYEAAAYFVAKGHARRAEVKRDVEALERGVADAKQRASSFWAASAECQKALGRCRVLFEPDLAAACASLVSSMIDLLPAADANRWDEARLAYRAGFTDVTEKARAFFDRE